MTKLHHLFTPNAPITEQVRTYRELAGYGFSQDHIRAAYRRKDIILLRRGVYTLAPLFTEADTRQKALLHHAAASKTSKSAAFSHLSAALWWDAKVLHLPDKVHLPVATNRNTQRNRVALHKNRSEAVKTAVLHRGLLVTHPVQTVIDCATTLPLPDALCVADDFLHRGLCSTDELRRALEATTAKGALRCRKVASLMSHLADSPAETLARLQIFLFRFEAPVEQLRITTRFGRVCFADFAWVDEKVILEVDGDIKYSGIYGDPREVVREERRRQKELEQAGWTVVRVGWNEVYREPHLLKQALWDAGLRPR